MTLDMWIDYKVNKGASVMDRGLVRRAVMAYAKVQGITYQDAHQVLSNGNAGVPTVAPNKFQDAEYQDRQRRACVVQSRRYRVAVA